MNPSKYIFDFIKSNFVVVLIMTVIIITNFNIERWKTKNVIKWDVTSYYSYLPAAFIYNDLTLDFYKEDVDYFDENHMFFPVEAENGNHVIKTTMGMSILYAPFFGIAYLDAKITGVKFKGFSTSFHKWIHLSALFYLFFGLYYLNKFLSKTFNKTSSGITLTLIIFGSNLFYYATTEASMTHVYNFSLVGIFIYIFDLWYTNANFKKSVLLGMILGLLVLIRPTNILILLFPLFYNATSFKLVIDNLKKYFLTNAKFFFIIVLISILIVFPQLLYWKTMTGSWLFNSYVNESFYFNNPHLINMFFSFRKGWLLYSPIMFFSVIGFVFLFKIHKKLFWSCLIPFIVLSYVFSSWWSWWYGGSFGLRTMIDVYAYLTIPMAAFITYILKTKKSISLIFFFVFISLIFFNFFQTIQYRNNVIHWDSMSKEAYIKTFGKIKFEEKFNYYYKTPDYYKARTGGVEYE